MPRPEKVQAVAEIKERIEGAQAVFLAEYAGLSVKDQQALRRELRANGAEFKVVKMTLARRAADDLEIESLEELLLGPTGLAFADGDPAGAAKVLKDFAKDHEVFVIKGGLLGIEFLTPEKISELADLDPRDVLLAKIAGAMQAPMSNLAGLLAALPRDTASVLQQLLEKKESGEFASADEEAPAEEASADADDADADASAPQKEDAVEVEAEEASDAADTDEAEATEDAPADAEAADADAPAADADEAPEEEASSDEEEPAAEVAEADEADESDSDVEEDPAPEASEEESADADTETEEDSDATDDASADAEVADAEASADEDADASDADDKAEAASDEDAEEK